METKTSETIVRHLKGIIAALEKEEPREKDNESWIPSNDLLKDHLIKRKEMPKRTR